MKDNDKANEYELVVKDWIRIAKGYQNRTLTHPNKKFMLYMIDKFIPKSEEGMWMNNIRSN